MIVENYCEDVGRLVRRSMLDVIPDGEPHRWLYRVARAYPSRPGKGIRPALCVATSRAFGGDDGDALPVAVAIELLHNAFLIHDDIVDGSERRRGARRWSPSTAGAGPQRGRRAGRAGQPRAARPRPAARRGPRRPRAGRVRHDGPAHARGPGHRARLAPRPRHRARARGLPRPDHAQDVLVHDRAPAARRGADRRRGDLRPFVRFGFHLGAAFQIQDDLLNLVGSEGVRQGDRRRPLRGQAHAAAHPPDPHARGADRALVDRYLALDRAERDAELSPASAR